jgi:tetrapyrrole methylase family protein / MazG family protein
MSHKTICYLVPGHPSVGEITVERLQRIAPRLGITIQLVAGLSFLEPLLSVMNLDLLDGITVHDALAIESFKEPCYNHLILAQVYSRAIASKVKLKLLDLYPADYPVILIRAAGMPGEITKKIPLHKLDREDNFDHHTTIYLSPYPGSRVGELIEIMARLRAKGGCPWDQRQNHQTLRQYLVEEAYEVVAAIDSKDDAAIVDELGDLLLQVVFHSQIAREENRFTFYDVVAAINKKLVRRHPHVFGSRNAADADAVKVLWEEIKSTERNEEKGKPLISVDQALPALLKAYKLQKKAAEVGFDWPTIEGPLEKAREELAELEAACADGEQAAIEEELGDFLFTAVNLARFLKVNPELALGKTSAKFINRFRYVMEQVVNSGKPVSSFSLEKLDYWWNEAKNIKEIGKKRRSIKNDDE